MRKGWFKIPGVQDGDRTLEEQIHAVRPALALAQGRRVLDMGCAEGLISREFLLAGAVYVQGIDAIADHIEVAKTQLAGIDASKWSLRVASLNELVFHEKTAYERTYDIVLALGVIHKMHNPADGVEFAAKSARELVLYRAKGGVTDGIIKAKHRPAWCDAWAMMRAYGFELEKVVPGDGTYDETVEYWRKR